MLRVYVRKMKCLLALLLIFAINMTANAFVVKRIQTRGLNRVSRSSLISYLPIRVGQNVAPSASGKIIQALYKTGFFSNVQILRRGSTLIIKVQEAPTIGLLSVTGNKEISNKQLKPVMTSLGIQEGQTVNYNKLNQLRMGLVQEYKNLGYYAATIQTKLIKKSRNRVALSIDIKEGPVAQIKSIKIVGNNAFSQRTLLKQFSLTTSGLFTFITHSDRYSAMKLEKDLQNLSNYYMDHGYLQFRVTNKKVDVSKDNSKVNITISVSEGNVYKIGRITISGREKNNADMTKLVTLQSGQVFSRSNILAVDKSIAGYFRNRGYALPNVAVGTKVSEATKTVDLNFNVEPGQRVYVRRINFSGNDQTQDLVLRSRLRQMEGSLYSQQMIDDSKRKLSLLPYFRNVQVKVTPVPGKPDQVDLTYSVKEVPAGAFSIKGGYGDYQKFFYGVSIYQANFNGTGKGVSLGFQQSKLQTQVSLSIVNPMYTDYGVSRSVSVTYSKSTPSDLGLGDYALDDIGFALNYGIPITENNSINLGFGYDYNYVHSIADGASPSILNFVDKYGKAYNQFNVSLGWSYDTRDRFPFAFTGGLLSFNTELGVPASNGTKGKGGFVSLGYYRATFTAQWYYKLGDLGFDLSPHLTLGYGAGMAGYDAMPFFKNFFAGGVTSLPGFAPGSLGPKYKDADGNEQYLGGNVQLLAGLNFIFPNFISDELRTALFVDAGNVFDTHHVDGVHYEDISWKNIRASAGLLVAWYIPHLGPLQFSFAAPLVKRKDDDTAIFGFTVGASL